VHGSPNSVIFCFVGRQLPKVENHCFKSLFFNQSAISQKIWLTYLFGVLQNLSEPYFPRNYHKFANINTKYETKILRLSSWYASIFFCYLVFQSQKKIEIDCFRAGVHNSNLMAGQKFFFDISKGQRWYVLTHSKGVFPKKEAK